jgi:hypothetical protein
MIYPLSDHQLALIERPIEGKIFLEGPANTDSPPMLGISCACSTPASRLGRFC